MSCRQSGRGLTRVWLDEQDDGWEGEEKGLWEDNGPT